MVQMWEIRPRNQCFDAIRIYEGYPTMFTIELHHGGRFTKFPGISYIEGKLDHIDLVDMDEFSVHELDEVMLKLGYDVPQSFTTTINCQMEIWSLVLEL
ncbi:unnamed protein product [Lactuca saligna]|uniref:PB1-like domain-containing protein n=1 Tax=Lactuca saligna TaxID=75948 RepID=A0AA35Y5K9_LACSI|nr:unnamed protein product [Lactuca saligna]